MGQCQVAVVRPARVGLDIVGDDGRAGVHGRSAGADVRADLQAVDGRVVRVRQVRGHAVLDGVGLGVVEEHRPDHARSLRLDGLDQGAEDPPQRFTAGDLRQGLGLQAQAHRGLLAGRHVEPGAAEAGQRAVGVEDGPAANLLPAQRSVGRGGAVLEREGLAGGAGRVEHAPGVGRVGVGHKLGGRVAQQRIGGAPLHRFGLLGDVGVPARGVGLPDVLAGGLNHVLKPLLAATALCGLAAQLQLVDDDGGQVVQPLQLRR